VAREAAVRGNDVRFIASGATILRAPGSFDGDTLTRTMGPDFTPHLGSPYSAFGALVRATQVVRCMTPASTSPVRGT